MTPNMMKWISGFAAVTFMACYAVFMAEQGAQLFSKPAALSYLICAPIALFVNGMILFQRGSYNVQPCSSEPKGSHHVVYLFIGVEYICVRYCLDKAPLGCVPNSMFLAYQEHMVLMTVYNLLAAFFLAFFIRILFARKFVIFDGEDAEGKIEPPRSDEDMIVFNELVKDVQGLMEEVKSSKGDEKDLAERVKETTEDLKNLMDFIKKTI